MTDATETDEKIRQLFEEGCSQTEIAKEMELPMAVIGAWVERETTSKQEEKDDASETDSHEGPDWSVFG